MKKIKLSPRLELIAEYALGGRSIIDVGTDHGQVPVYIAQSTENVKIAASDLRSGPLDSARRTAFEYNVADKIEFVLANGLDGADGTSTDTVIIAGMGGENIASILSRAVWTAQRDVKLVLQPQSKLHELEGWLMQNGYGIAEASLVRDEGRIYSVWLCRGNETGKPGFEELLMDRRDVLMPEYLDEIIKKLKSVLCSMEGAEGLDGKREELRRSLNRYTKMREETETWRR